MSQIKVGDEAPTFFVRDLAEQMNFRLKKSILVDDLKCYCILPCKKDNIEYQLKEVLLYSAAM